jgi:Domain of unknown function (DUF3883)
MLRLELGGRPFNKAERNREVQALTGRVRGGVERKHQNISSILRDLGLPYIDGYKPLGNRQKILEDLVINVIGMDPEVNALAREVVERDRFERPRDFDLLAALVDAPKPEKELYAKLADLPRQQVPRLGINYAEIESRNRALGLAGELFALEFESQRLWRAGAKKLADRIEHVAATKGDGLGYDIRSFEVDGRERLVEVKTTQFGGLTPFFATRNEVSVSAAEAERYQVYRIYSFARNPQLFLLPGSMARSCELLPLAFSATPSGRI